MLEHAGGAPLEGALLTFPGGDTLGLNLNVQNTGQGHASVFPRLVAERLGIPAERIHHRHGDSALEIAGFASVGSRSAMTVSNSLLKAIDLMLAKGKSVAATMLETAEADIAYRDGRFEVVGTDRRVSLFDVAARAAEMARSAARLPRASTPGPRPRRRSPSPTAATSPRSRSIPTPERLRSSPTRRSTIAATRSTP